MKGKAISDPHRKRKTYARRESEPAASGDFSFQGQSGEQGTAPVFVLRDHSLRVTFTHVT